jgi:hypothetical protein
VAAAWAHAVDDDTLEACIGKDRFGDFRKMHLGEGDDRRVYFDPGEMPHRLVLEDFFGNGATAAADDQYLARITVPKERHPGHHLLIDELVARGDLRHAIEHQHFAEGPMLEQNEVPMRRAHFGDDLVGPAAHANVVETESHPIVARRTDQQRRSPHECKALGVNQFLGKEP